MSGSGGETGTKNKIAACRIQFQVDADCEVCPFVTETGYKKRGACCEAGFIWKAFSLRLLFEDKKCVKYIWGEKEKKNQRSEV